MSDSSPKTTYLKDYERPVYQVENVSLTFDLDWTSTTVTCVQDLELNSEYKGLTNSLILNGEELKLISVKVNGADYTNYDLKEDQLIINDLPEKCELEIINKINPEANKALEGLYKSGNILCTQNESEGFRRITYYQDRPDVMAKYTTKIIGDKKEFPILLANGNKIDGGELDNNKHWALWEDPYKKPCYLFALVAGDLGIITDNYVTTSGRNVQLEIYCDKGNEYKCEHAMVSLKKSMKWDEDVFGLEYDLDLYMIVAVDSFNAGAMENKGLNIFNSALTLASQKTATDTDFYRIESVIGHEYFHNWTGNRVTCRDWFQLTLKEGLTVFRDQEFSSDLNSRSVQRISDVQALRASQYPEDAGPMAHPIRPESYISIDNFYSATVYEKGAEVIRMVHTLLGKEGFVNGIKKYFELFDGGAVTTEDFLHAMSIANDNFDFSQFKNWYSQSGTPIVDVNSSYDETTKLFKLTIKQSFTDTPGQPSSEKKPFHFPLSIGLVGKDGKDIHTEMIQVTKLEETFEFTAAEKPIASINREFSAPIILNANYSTDDLVFLMAHDSDEFNRYEAAQTLGVKVIHELLDNLKNNKELVLDEKYSNAYGAILSDTSIDSWFKSICLGLPLQSMIYSSLDEINFGAITQVYDFIRKELAQNHSKKWMEIYNSLNIEGEYKLDPQSMGNRALKNTALGFLNELGNDELVFNQFKSATNMTDELASLSLLASLESEKRDIAISDFYEKYKDELLVMVKWFGVQASSKHPKTFELVKELENHPQFDKTIPNLVRSLFGGINNNNRFFHEATGKGYKYAADKIIEIDAINPQVGGRSAAVFKYYKKLNPQNKALMKIELERILATEGLSKNTFEVISRTLA